MVYLSVKHLFRSVVLLCSLLPVALLPQVKKIALIVSNTPNDTSDRYLSEIKMLEKEIESKGFQVDRLDWKSKQADWTTYQYIFIGDLGSYEDYPELRRWCQQLISLNVPIQNGAKTVALYTRKSHYLKQLEKLNAPVIPTVVISKGSSQVQLKEMMVEQGWTIAVVKASESFFGQKNFVVDQERAVESTSRILNMLKTSDVLVQQFMPRIREGEISFLFYGGQFSHAIQKKPAPSEHRIHRIYGGQHQRYQPTKQEINQIKNIISKMETLSHQRVDKVRVDVVRDQDNQFKIIEIEVSDPTQYLWFLKDKGEKTIKHFVKSVLG